MKSILAEGKNCWRIRKAGRVAFLVDAAAYFEAFADAAARADKSVLIACWDIDSRIKLFEKKNRKGPPNRLWELMNYVVKKHKSLHVKILEWDFAVIYAAERQLFPVFKLPWRKNNRIDFRLDNNHPLGGCHHQKVVVIDDKVAFAGGIDLTKNRWDTPEHIPNDPRRVDPSGKPYGPFHDVQMAVDGEAAATLGELFRTRWLRATGERLEAPRTVRHDPWPPGLRADLEKIDIAIVRTDPEHNSHEAVREVEALYLDTIGAAERFIYIENQYLSSFSVGKAIAESLRQAEGPEIVVVLRVDSDWLEEATMGVLRARMLSHLREADAYGRLRVYYPEVPGLDGEVLNVHAKVMIADGTFVRIGSSNLSNRSMGVDTECDLAVESSGKKYTENGIFAFQSRLLGEHLGLTTDEVSHAIEDEKSLIRGIERLKGTGRTLLPFPEEEIPWATDLIFDSPVDPVEPIDFNKLVEELVPEDAAETSSHNLRWFILLLILLCLAAVWKWTPLSEWLDRDAMAAAGAYLKNQAASPLIILSAYVAGSLVMFPVTLLILVTAFTFGPIDGILYSILGCVLSSVTTYGIGHWLGRDRVSRLSGSRVNRLSKRLARHGVIAVGTVRIIPIAPFAVVNLVAGASHIRLMDFLLGTIIGMAPGIIAITLFEHQIESAIKDPGLGSFALLTALAAAILAGIFIVKSKLLQKDSGNKKS
ncbi:MAG: VTT domain-containing protein [Desulfatiglandaceae bacterium]